MDDSFIIVYVNAGKKHPSKYIQETPWGEDIGLLAQTVSSVVDATLYNSWDEAFEKIKKLKQANIDGGFEASTFFPLSVNKKELFLAKLKGQR